MNIRILRILGLACPACMLAATLLNAQVTYQKHSVANPFTRSAGLGLADVDRDGDPDILAGSGLRGLFWYENQGGKPVTWTSHTVDGSAGGSLSVVASDIDKDGLTDLVGGAWDDNTVAWYRNTGNQHWQKIIISNSCGQVHEVFVHDVDGDGLDDILAAAVGNNEIVWFRNPGNTTGAWMRQQITNTCGGARTVSSADLDGDGKSDIVAGAFLNNKITIWKNLGGSPVQWEEINLITNYGGAHRVQLVDVNQDGKTDIVGWGYLQNALRWWENTGNLRSWVMHVVDDNLNTSCVGQACDIDLDGDMDIVSTGYSSNLVVWYENTDGRAASWKKHTVDNSLVQPWMAFAGDIDGDIDIDIIAGGDAGNEIRWYENHPSGRMNSYIDLPGVRLKTDISLPRGYDEGYGHELLLALPAPGDEKTIPMMRDYLSEVSDSRGTIVFVSDVPLAQAPGYNFTDPSVINAIIEYAATRFTVDRSRVYLLGAACQGLPVLKGSLSGFDVKGGIALYPETAGFNPDDWPVSEIPLSIASGPSQPAYHEVSDLADNLWRAGRMVRLVSADGSATDYLNDRLADVTIRCMNYIDSAAFLTGKDDINRIQQAFEIKLEGSQGHPVICITGPVKGFLKADLMDLQGRVVKRLYEGRTEGNTLLIPVNTPPNHTPGMYLIRLTGPGGAGTCRRIIL